MTADDREIDTVTQRAAYVGFNMALGWTPKTREVAERFNMSDGGAWDLMSHVSNILPIAQDYDGRWCVTEDSQRRHRHYVCTA
jgi:hypothetical protein